MMQQCRQQNRRKIARKTMVFINHIRQKGTGLMPKMLTVQARRLVFVGILDTVVVLCGCIVVVVWGRSVGNVG